MGAAQTAAVSSGPIGRWLAEDHRRLDTLLRQAIAPTPRIERQAWDAFRRGLLRHIAIEEKLLLPAIERAQGAPVPIAARLRTDHGAIASLFVPSPTTTIVTTLRDILGAHNAAEEASAGLYAEADRVLASRAEELVLEMASYPAVRTAPHNDGPDVLPAVWRALERAGYRLRDAAP